MPAQGLKRFGIPLLASAPALAALAAMPFVTRLRDHTSGNLAAALWGLIILVSFTGWGTFLGRLIVPERALDWGLRATIGMAAVLAFGGLSQLLCAADASTSITVVAVGLLARVVVDLIWVRQHDPARSPRLLARLRADPTGALLIASLYVLAALVYYANVTHEVANIYDDFEAYIPFAKQLMQTGSFDQPFSLRRLASLGGQTYLHALFLSLSATRYLNAVDNGICLLTLFGLVLGLDRDGRAHGRPGALLAAILLLLDTNSFVHNTASSLSGAVFIFAAYRLLLPGFAESRSRSVLLALILSAGWTLRQNYAVALIVVFGVAYALAALDNPARRRAILMNFGYTLGLTIALLVPWFAATYRSSGTFLFPLLLGNARADCGLLEHATLIDEIKFFKLVFSQPAPVRSIGLFFLAALAIKRPRRDSALIALTLGALAGWFATVHALVAIDDLGAVNRYTTAHVMAFTLAVIPAALSGLERRGPGFARAVTAVILAFLGFALQFNDNRAELVEKAGSAAVNMLAELKRPNIAERPFNPFYDEIQKAVPPGARLLSILGEPQNFDFNRNEILLCDQPGRASPGRAMPIGGTTADYENYFRTQNIRYIAYIWGRGSPEYQPDIWQRWFTPRLESLNITGSSHGFELKAQASLYLDVFEHIVALRKAHKILYRAYDTFLFDLDQPADPEPPAPTPIQAQASPQPAAAVPQPPPRAIARKAPKAGHRGHRKK